jgi:hypothetical protein
MMYRDSNSGIRSNSGIPTVEFVLTVEFPDMYQNR